MNLRHAARENKSHQLDYSKTGRNKHGNRMIFKTDIHFFKQREKNKSQEATKVRRLVLPKIGPVQRLNISRTVPTSEKE